VTAVSRGVTPEPPPTISSRTDVEGRLIDLGVLAQRASDGDPHARDLLLADVRGIVYRYCRARLGQLPASQQTADDVAQEACIAVLSALPGYEDRGRPFEAFVYGIAAHKVADAQRQVMRAPVPTDPLPDTVEDGLGPADQVVRADEAAQARGLLDLLPPAQRELLVLRAAAGAAPGRSAARRPRRGRHGRDRSGAVDQRGGRLR
jgi:RNA polymerase sigma-70 factor, ECF subfamily